MKVEKPSGNQFPLALALVLMLTVGALAAWGVRVWTGVGIDPDVVWKQAQADLRAGQPERARAAIARLAQLRAPTAEDRMLKAQTSVAAGRADEALAELSRIPDAHPLAPQARLLAGQVELRRSHVQAAERQFHAAIALEPTLVQAHRELIYIYGMLVRRRDLYNEFHALSRLVPLTYQNVFDWSLTRNALWEPKELTPVLRGYVAADPADRWSRLALAENLRQVGRFDEADKALDALPSSDPDARAVRVRLALDRGDDRGAEALLADGPADHAELARLRGRVALAHRDGAAALKHFRAADKAEPNYRDTLFGLGQALSLVGDEAAAAPYIAAARKIDAIGTLLQRAAETSNRNDPNLMRAIAAACEKAHRYPEARAWYNLAIAADPLDADTQKALFRLKALDPPPESSKPAATPTRP